MGSPIGMWTAVSGAMAQSQNLDTIANNIANTNTSGFKKDEVQFKEYLTAYERPPSPAIDIPRTIFKDSDFYHTDGREHSMVTVEKINTDHTQGALKPTGTQLDCALDGPGFFTLRTPEGLRFSRAGDFKINSDGKLVTTDGHPVMALSDTGGKAGGANPFVDKPKIKDPINPEEAQQELLQEIDLKDFVAVGKKISINEQGEIFSGSSKIAKLAVAEFVDAKLLKKESSTMYSNPNAINVPRASERSQVHQGFLELSNVNSVVEMVNLIKANRQFETNMRAIKTYSEMSAKEANEVGKL